MLSVLGATVHEKKRWTSCTLASKFEMSTIFFHVLLRSTLYREVTLNNEAGSVLDLLEGPGDLVLQIVHVGRPRAEDLNKIEWLLK